MSNGMEFYWVTGRTWCSPLVQPYGVTCISDGLQMGLHVTVRKRPSKTKIPEYDVGRCRFLWRGQVDIKKMTRGNSIKGALVTSKRSGSFQLFSWRQLGHLTTCLRAGRSQTVLNESRIGSSEIARLTSSGKTIRGTASAEHFTFSIKKNISFTVYPSKTDELNIHPNDEHRATVRDKKLFNNAMLTE